MRPILVVIIVLIVFAVFTFFASKVYNSLVILNNKIKDNWLELYQEISFRYELIDKYLKLINNEKYNTYISKINLLYQEFKELNVHEKIMDNYISLEKNFKELKSIITDINYPDWEKSLTDSKTRLDSKRNAYNDNCLAINNKVDLFPFSVVASMFKFQKHIFFRNEE